MAILKKVTGNPPGQCIEIRGETTLIGRAPECHIVLDPFGVSRRHAEIRREGDRFQLIDLDSRNKTKLNDEFIAPLKGYTLRKGDRINICDIEFIFYPSATETMKSGAGEVLVVEGGGHESTFHTLDASQSSVTTSAVRPEAKIAAILEISRNLSSDLNIETVAPKILKSLFNLFKQAERGFLVLQDPQTKRLIPKAFEHRQLRTSGRGPIDGPAYSDEAPMSISKSIINQVLIEKRAVLSQDAGQEIPTSASIADLKIRSVMCAPLLTPDGQALGILQLDTSNRRQFQQEDLDLLVAVANQAAIFMQNAQMHQEILERERLDRDLRLAEQVQKRFLPQTTPKLAGYEFFAHYHPAYEVGGDYYDFVPLPHNRLAVAVGDVSGKGIAAALMMAKFSGDTRYCILTETAPGPACDALNALLYAAGIEERFITLSLGVLDFRRHILTLASAGHPPVMIRRGDGRVEEIGDEIAGFPLGIVPTSSYQQTEVELRPGDVVLIYSDGVTDARNPQEELYDSRENRRLLRRIIAAKGGPSAIGRAILQEIREFSAGHPQADDITLICFGPLSEA
jgi:sigma-B regulation protein RsbU (phosphoserine phosphatase)